MHEWNSFFSIQNYHYYIYQTCILSLFPLNTHTHQTEQVSYIPELAAIFWKWLPEYEYIGTNLVFLRPKINLYHGLFKQ